MTSTQAVITITLLASLIIGSLLRVFITRWWTGRRVVRRTPHTGSMRTNPDVRWIVSCYEPDTGEHEFPFLSERDMLRTLPTLIVTYRGAKTFYIERN